MKSKSIILLMIASLVLLLAAFTSDKQQDGDFESDKELIIMRKIADQVLRYIGDSSSPILPVKQLSENQFQIPFEFSFSFMPDSLVAIINKVIAENKYPVDYIVHVTESVNNDIVYGYAYISSKKQEIVPCSGREQKNQHYSIDIRFKEHEVLTSKTLYISSFSLLGLGFLLLGMQLIKKRNINAQSIETIEVDEGEINDEMIAIGQFIFFPDELLMTFNDEQIVLTIKEAKLLSIFAKAPNTTIDRSRLQKEVWEDEGVIVGRSLDMFISKLRKKLEEDPNVTLVNIHSKGYRLQINI